MGKPEMGALGTRLSREPSWDIVCRIRPLASLSHPMVPSRLARCSALRLSFGVAAAAAAVAGMASRSSRRIHAGGRPHLDERQRRSPRRVRPGDLGVGRVAGPAIRAGNAEALVPRLAPVFLSPIGREHSLIAGGYFTTETRCA